MSVIEYSETIPLSFADLENAIKGKTKVVWLQEPIPLHLSGEEKKEFEGGKSKGFINNFKDRDNLLNAWFHWCEIEKKPYVYFQKKGEDDKKSLLVVDMITANLPQIPNTVISLISEYTKRGIVKTKKDLFSSTRIELTVSSILIQDITEQIMQLLSNDKQTNNKKVLMN